MRRNVKLEFYDHRITCPHCKTLLIFTASVKQLSLVRRTCLKCEKEFLIENGVGVRLDRPKPPKRARTSKPTG
jgi:RNase P subunit RPR2